MTHDTSFRVQIVNWMLCASPAPETRLWGQGVSFRSRGEGYGTGSLQRVLGQDRACSPADPESDNRVLFIRSRSWRQGASADERRVGGLKSTR